MSGGKRGFTLIEVLVSLAVALLITGGVMGLFSSGFQLLSRVKTKTADMRVLDAAAQMILADPGLLWEKDALEVEGLAGDPVVNVGLAKVEQLENTELEYDDRGLYRVELSYGKTSIWFSMVITADDYKDKADGDG